MEKDTNPQIMYENLVSTKKYAALYNVTQKTVYDWINTDRVDLIEFSDRKWLDKTIPVRPSVKQLKVA